MLWLIFSVVTAASHAPVTLSNCEMADLRGQTAMRCDLTNTGTEAIASIRFRAVLRDENRTVPWAATPGSSTETVAISGGIEPGESLSELLVLPSIPERAEKETLRIEILDLRAFGLDDLPIPRGGPASASAPAAWAERCWNVGALSAEAQRATIAVRFEIGHDGKPISDTIKLADTDAGPGPTDQAFEAARRAILRCGAIWAPELTPGSMVLRFSRGRAFME